MSRSIQGLSWREQRLVKRLQRVRRLKLIRRRSVEEGFFGGSPKWIAIGLLTWGVWVLQQAWRRDAELVYRTQLKPGESLVIRSSRPGK